MANCGDIEATPVPEGSFQCAVCIQVKPNDRRVKQTTGADVCRFCWDQGILWSAKQARENLFSVSEYAQKGDSA